MTTNARGAARLVVIFIIGIAVGQLTVERAFEVAGYRLGFGSCGYALQRTSDWSVISTRHDLWCSR